MQRSTEDVRDVLRLLRRRQALLDHLREAPADKRTLEDALDVSRSTIDRALATLTDRGLVAATADDFQLTVFGRVLFDTYVECRGTVTDLERAAPLLEHVPLDAPIAIDVVRDAELVWGDAPAPNEPGSRVGELFTAADRIRGIAYAYTDPRAGEIVRAKLAADDADVAVVYRREMYDYFADADSDVIEAFENASNAEIRVLDDPPYALFVLTDDVTRACLCVYDDNDTLVGVVVNDAPAAVEWATGVFDHYWARAESVTP